MRSLGRFFRTDAVAGGELATAEIDPELREQTRTSVDGAWWWDGRRWVPTSTPDGLWHWDGMRWQSTIDLRSARSRDLATTLAFLAEDRYARAAAILVDHTRDWQPEGEVRDLVGRAVTMRRGLRRVDGIVRAGYGTSGRFRRRRAGPAERQRIEEEHALLDTRYRALLVRLGRLAPRPTMKEADDLLDVASQLDQRSSRITEALAAGDEAERSRANAIEAARTELKAAEAARVAATGAAALALARARAERAIERRATRRRLFEALAGDGGEALAEVGPLRAHETSIETPAGRLPADGACAWVGPAVVLWREARGSLQDVLVLETPESSVFLRCLAERRHDQFLLLATHSRTLLWPCPPGEEKPLRQFAAVVNRQSSRAVELAAARLAAAEKARVELSAAAAAAADQVAQAQAVLAGVEADQRASAAVEAAARRMREARADPPALIAARRSVAAEVQAVSTPPPPLAAGR